MDSEIATTNERAGVHLNVGAYVVNVTAYRLVSHGMIVRFYALLNIQDGADLGAIQS